MSIKEIITLILIGMLGTTYDLGMIALCIIMLASENYLMSAGFLIMFLGGGFVIAAIITNLTKSIIDGIEKRFV